MSARPGPGAGGREPLLERFGRGPRLGPGPLRVRAARGAGPRRQRCRDDVVVGQGPGLHGGDLQGDRCRIGGVRQRDGGGRAAFRPGLIVQRIRGGEVPTCGGGPAALRGLRHRHPVWGTTQSRRDGRAVTF